MKKFAISNYIPKNNLEYLTPGKKYEIKEELEDGLFLICSDDDDDDHPGCICSYNGCAHLGWANWTIIEEEE